jgi:hypothetical protein
VQQPQRGKPAAVACREEERDGVEDEELDVVGELRDAEVGLLGEELLEDAVCGEPGVGLRDLGCGVVEVEVEEGGQRMRAVGERGGSGGSGGGGEGE